ncbi:MAG TPA: efflux RND transporter periplasmic adaptor subunit [Bacteroidota bacterium]|nr:efflux RND transporter periplasmic adaptor subunit [Bacteroidota bacterium]
MKKKVVISSSAVVVLAVTGYIIFAGSRNSNDNGLPKVRVSRATITDKVLAVGTIEPENEISIKSQVSGVVKKMYADAGTYVHAGDPLLEIKPDPTPLELADAKRQVQLMQVDLTNLTKERTRQDSLKAKQLISDQDFEQFMSNFESSQLKLKMAQEHLALIESGKVKIDETEIESIVKAPIDGFILSKSVEVGDPVTPLTTYQEGTVLMKMANMDHLVFKGTVDEIDVGKLKEGMEAELKVGALPTDTVKGILTKISLKADKKDNATVFPIEVQIPKGVRITLRAGYSANASIIIQKKQSVLTLPERVVTFRNDSAFVKVPKGAGKPEDILIKTGLSDAINVEIVSGLKDSDEVFEKPVKKIE